MKTRFKVDVSTGEFTRLAQGAEMPSTLDAVFFARDVLDCEVQLFAGATDVTATLLANSAKLSLALRIFPGKGALLAMSGPITLADGVASCTFDLNTLAIANAVSAFNDTTRRCRVWFEIVLEAADRSKRQTIVQTQGWLQDEVLIPGEIPPATAEQANANAAQSAAAAAQSEEAAEEYANDAKASRDDALGFRNQAEGFKNAASQYAQDLDAAKQAAEAAAASATGSKQDAEAARTGAEEARDLALNYRDAAQGFRDEAENSKNSASASAGTATTKANEASASAGTATAQAAISTTKAAESLSSANAAALSAAQAAAIAAGLNYKGTQAGASVPATSTSSGDCYLIVSTGTSQSKTWALFDLAIYNGTSGSWTQVANALWAGLSLPMVMGRRTTDLCISDGATSNRRIEWALGTAGAVAAMPISIPFEFDVPTSNPGASRWFVFRFIPSGGSEGSASALAAYFEASTADLVIRQMNADGSSWRRAVATNFRSTYSGLRVKGAFVFEAPGTTTAPKLYAQGVEIATTQATSGSGASWLSTLASDFYQFGRDWPSGRFVPHAPILGALSAAEVLEWTQTGRLPMWCEVGTGSAVTKYSSDFSAGVDGWSAQAGTATGNVDGVSDGTTTKDDVLRYVGNSTAAFPALQRLNALTIGRRYRVRFSYYIPSANTTIRKFYLGSQSNLRIAGASASQYAIAATVGSWSVADFEYEPLSTSLVLGLASAADGTNAANADTAYVVGLTVHDLGPIFKPTIQPCRILDDAGGNGICGVVASGITPITERRGWRFRATVDMSSTGNKQLFGAAVFDTPQNQALDSIEPTHGANGATYSIGDGTTATAYTANAAQTSGRKRLTITNPFPADSGKTGLYANVTVAGVSETAVPITVRGHRID